MSGKWLVTPTASLLLAGVFYLPPKLAGQSSTSNDNRQSLETKPHKDVKQFDPTSLDIMLLRSPDARTRVRGAKELGPSKDPRAVEPLMAALKDEDTDVRRSAAAALGEIKDARAVPALIALLKDANVYVGTQASDALGKIGEAAIDPLIFALRGADIQVRRYAVSALGQIRIAPVVDQVIPILSDPERMVRRDAADVLGIIRDPRAVGPLLSVLGEHGIIDSDLLRDSVSNALVSIGTPALEPLISALKNRDWHVQRDAAIKLARFKDARAVDSLAAGLRDHEFGVIVGAYPFFIERGEPGSEDALIDALNSDRDKDMTLADSTMAGAFLNCGNSALEAAASKWASDHHYSIVSRRSFQRHWWRGVPSLP